MPSQPAQSRSPLNNVVLYFGLFLILNAWLAYGSQGLLRNIVFFIFGIVFLAVLFTLSPSGTTSEGSAKKDISVTGFCAILLVALLPRLYVLLNPAWPLTDDGLNTFTSLELSQKWEWHFFFTTAQSPLANNWLQSLYFKFVPVTFFSMKLYYFVFSYATLGLAFVAARVAFSNKMAWFCLLLTAFGFPVLYTSRFCMYAQPLLTFQVLSLLVLALALKRQKDRNPALGYVTGLGFWVAIQWPIQAFFLALTTFKGSSIGEKIKNSLRDRAFWSLTAAGFLSFLYLSIWSKNGDHIQYLLTLPANGSSRLESFLSNGTSLFWGCDLQNSYGPVWGGMLNPVAGALFMIGAIGLIRDHRSSTSRWILALFIFSFLPGLLTPSFDFFRNALATPLLVLIAAFGLQRLDQGLRPSWRVSVLTLILLASSMLDLIHLWKTYQPTSQGSSYSTNSGSFSRADQILEKTYQERGPGSLLWGLTDDISDTTLDVATYSFNTAENPSLKDFQPQWTAFIANANYKPFLAERFPAARFYWLGPDTLWNQGGLVLTIVDKDKKSGPLLERWEKVNTKFYRYTHDYFMDPLNEQRKAQYLSFLQNEPAASEDPFLHSLFFEKCVYFDRFNPSRHSLIGLMDDAVKKGYPAAHLWVTQALLLRQEGKYKEAEMDLRKALACPLNLTNAEAELRYTLALEKPPTVP